MVLCNVPANHRIACKSAVSTTRVYAPICTRMRRKRSHGAVTDTYARCQANADCATLGLRVYLPVSPGPAAYGACCGRCQARPCPHGAMCREVDQSKVPHLLTASPEA